MIATPRTDSNPADPAEFDRLRDLPAALLKKLGSDKPSPAALSALKERIPEPVLFQHAANLPRARHKLRNKLRLAATAFADIPRAEMATARPVALYRMRRLLAAASGAADAAAPGSPGGAADARTVFELGCGAGADLCAFIEEALAAGLPPHALATRIQAVENDPFAAWCARANAEALCPGLPPETVSCADAATVIAGLLNHSAENARVGDRPARSVAPAASGGILFMDPTRRKLGAAHGRTVNDWSQCEPPSAVWAPWIAAGRPLAMKVAPAFDWRSFDPTVLLGGPLGQSLGNARQPPQIEAIEWHGEVHELTLWWNFDAPRDAAPGRRATVVAGDASIDPAALRSDSVFVPEAELAGLRHTLLFSEHPLTLGDVIAIPAPAVLRLDLAPAIAARFQAEALAGQPQLFRVPLEQTAAAAASLLVKTGRVVADVAAREKDLRRVLNAEPLKHRRWQPQVLGVKGVPGIEDRLRQLEIHSARVKSAGNSSTPAAGVALVTRIHQSHRVIFLEPL